MDLGVLSIKETSTVSTHILDPREYGRIPCSETG